MLRLLGLGSDFLNVKLKNLMGNEETFVDRMSDKGGAYAKIAQALQIGDSSHKSFSACNPINPEKTLERVQNYQTLHPSLEIEDEASWFGSTAQVHRAFSSEVDESIVIKAKYVGIENILQDDLQVLSSGIKLFDRKKKFHVYVEDMKSTIMNELDYSREIKYIKYIREINTKHNLGIQVPTVIDRFCSDNFICMTQIMGQTLSAWIEGKSQEEKNKLAEKISKFVYTLMNQYDVVYCDPHWSNFLIDENEEGETILSVVDFGSIGEVPRSYRAQRFTFHYACIDRDFEKFQKSAYDMELFSEDINQEDKVTIFNYFICHLRPFAVDSFTFDEKFLLRCREIPMHILRNINVRSHLYAFTKLSYNMNSLLCTLKATANFKKIMEASMTPKLNK